MPKMYRIEIKRFGSSSRSPTPSLRRESRPVTKAELEELLRSGPGGIAKWNELRKDPNKIVSNDLARIDLSECELVDADFRNMIFVDADLSGANLEHAKLSGAKLRGAKLDGAKLRRANLRGACLERASLRTPNRPLAEVFADAHDDEEDLGGCNICHL